MPRRRGLVTVNVVLGLALAAIGLFNLYRAADGYRKGKAVWFAGRGLGISADREDDPVGYATAIWGNVLAGAFVLGMAAVVIFG